MEEEIMKKRANHPRGVLSDGGHLILTTKQIIFEPHGFNIGGKKVVISIDNVIDIGKTESTFGLSKEIWVNMKGGRLERFVVWGRDEFVDAVKKQIAEKK